MCFGKLFILREANFNLRSRGRKEKESLRDSSFSTPSKEQRQFISNSNILTKFEVKTLVPEILKCKPLEFKCSLVTFECEMTSH